MNAIDLKNEVEKALHNEWTGFASAHPKLAAVLDETVLLTPAMQSLSEDQEYIEAMQTATSVGAGAEVIGEIIARFVRQWLRTLI